jgi:uncharacterized protein (TIGR00730 family)
MTKEKRAERECEIVLRSVCVYCASSGRCAESYLAAAARLGRSLAGAGMRVVYGGSSLGSMGRMADAAMAAGAHVTGVMPRFMEEAEWSHTALSELRIVADMHERKRTMLELADAVIALPGGCGTLEELLEAITWKRLGLFSGPVVMVNVNGFYDACVALLNRSVEERFMEEKHRELWQVAGSPEEAVALLVGAKIHHA